jgi:hypothetical protein
MEHVDDTVAVTVMFDVAVPASARVASTTITIANQSCFDIACL